MTAITDIPVKSADGSTTDLSSEKDKVKHRDQIFQEEHSNGQEKTRSN